ncbi:MAG: hypothetical protein C4550_00995 [Nitrospiraceae bacterium]|nr:MAG: hypothetical protein C4550_00995 [Nitrospiraceae bacterium]
MARHGGAFKSDKRKKELVRQKKQEEKRQRRLNKNTGQEQGAETIVSDQKDGVALPIQDA